MSRILSDYDHLPEVLEPAIGPNDPPASQAQMVAHRERQIRNERFLNIESKEVTK